MLVRDELKPGEPAGRSRALFGVFVRRECWTLSRTARLVLLTFALAAAVTVWYGTYPFLAVNVPVDSDVLVIESWVPTHMLNQVAAEFWRGHYQKVLVMRATFGGPYGLIEGRDSGEYASNTLIKYGVPRNAVATVFYEAVDRDRTYHAAIAVKKWIDESGMAGKSLTVATVGPHARRTRLMYMKALGDEVSLGMVALQDPLYDPKHWWRTSEGVRDIIGETIAYLYARFFFSWA
jgi:hypothetical protein